MGTFLVLGTGPLLDEEGTTRVAGQCLRTLHFAAPMQAAGHRLLLATVPIPGTEDLDAPVPAVRRTDRATGIRYHALTTHREDRAVRWLRGVLRHRRFDGVVGINAYPAMLLACAAPDLPFWADLYGWTMAEGQIHGARIGHDWSYDHFWRMEARTLLEADRFSTVSERQANALFGELAMVGRLNSLTFSWPFATTIPAGIHPTYHDLARGGALPAALSHWPSDAHVVLWSGGYNAWTDVDLLAGALERAMQREPRLHFASTGGAIPGHDENSYARFRKLAAERLPAERTALLGWIDTEDVVALHSAAHVGINIDSRNTETRFGARTRLTNMLGAGLPVLTTEGTEIAAWIAENEAGTVTPLGDAEAFADALVDSVHRAEAWQRRAEHARTRALEDFSPECTLKDFLAWCERPERAPDRVDPDAPEALRARQQAAADLETIRWTRIKAEGEVPALLNDRASLAALRRKLPLRLWYRLKRWVKPS